jgi:hypothetical protein
LRILGIGAEEESDEGGSIDEKSEVHAGADHRRAEAA